jgi:hypothetical protein
MVHTHRINDQFDDAGVLSDDQFDKLTALLAAQHEEIQELIKPIHDIAILLLADRTDEKKDGEKKDDGKASS